MLTKTGLGGDSPPDQIDFSSTAVHEIGHAIGINHSEKSQALMNASYSKQYLICSRMIKKQRSQSMVKTIRLSVYRFFNSTAGGHFFTANQEREILSKAMTLFRVEGVGFFAISTAQSNKLGLEPVYRFFNAELGSHLFTAFEEEKDHLLSFSDFLSLRG